MSREGNKLGPGAGWALAIVAAVVVLGGGASLLSGDMGSPSRLEELGSEFADGRAILETSIADDGTGTFTAKSIATCAEGTVVRLDAGQAGTVDWTEDDYRCDAGSFVVRTETPATGVGEAGAVQGTWTITSGADDYGDMIGGGTVTLSSEPGQPDVLTGTIGYDY